jgi:hypothetical protein
MSGSGYQSVCPNCGAVMECYTDWKPYDTNSCTCLSCGFTAFTKESRLSLEEVNEERENRDLPPLEKLAEGNGFYKEPEKSERIAEVVGLMTDYNITLQDFIDEHNKAMEGKIKAL